MSIVAYAELKDSGVAWLGDVPIDWQVVPLKSVVSYNQDKLPETTDPALEFQYIEISDVDAIEGIGLLEVHDFANAPTRARRIVAGEDVIISTVRTYLRAIAWIDRSDDLLVASTGFCVLHAEKIESRFLKYAISSDPFIQDVISQSFGVSYPAINADRLVSIKIAVPPREVQIAIVSFLDREILKIDAAVRSQDQLIKLLEEKRSSEISRIIVSGRGDFDRQKESDVEWLGRIPRHWEIHRLGNLFGEVNIPSDDTRRILSISIHHGASDDELTEAESGRKVTRSEDRSKYKAVEPGDLVYNMMRAWQGGFGAVMVPGAVSPAYVVARPRSPHLAEFVELVLRTPNAIAEMKRHSRGITDFRMRLYWDRFKDIKIALPPEEEMIDILKHVRQLKLDTSRVVDAAKRMKAMLRERRAALITAAVTGKIDVRDHHHTDDREAA